MGTGYKGTFVISWSQTDLDGVSGASVRSLSVGQTWLWRGDVVRVVLASANRDASQFDQPNVLDVTRQDNRHLAFGMGIHYCLGAPLARLEGQIGLQTLFDTFPKLCLAVPIDQLEWRSGVLFRGLKQLPVRLH